MKWVAIMILLGVGWFWLNYEPVIEHGPGVLAPEVPEQTKILLGSKFAYDDFTMTPLANFDITARVLSRKDYSLGAGAKLAPTDLALGWGRMSDTAVIEQLSISQRNRWYHWKSRTSRLPIPEREIEQSSANMHIIPANDEVAAALREVNQGHVVQIQGKLVAVESDKGFRWKSSTSRNDTGGGACEIIYAEHLSYR